MQKPIVVIDVGRSAVKARAYSLGKTCDVVFPSLSCPAVQLSDDAAVAAASRETVEVNGRAYFTGDTARLQGGVAAAAGLSADWIETAEYKALLISTVQRFHAQGLRGLDDALVIVGTPAAQYNSHRGRLEAVTREVIGGEVKALSQPMGAYLSYILGANGLPIPDRLETASKRRRSYAAIEVGYYSSDFLLMREGVQVEEKNASCEGIYLAAEKLMRILAAQGIETTQLECEQALRSGSIMHFGEQDVKQQGAEAIELVVDKIAVKADTLFGKEVRTLDAVLIAGGGASVVFPSLKERWPNCVMLENPRMAVAEGFLRSAKGLQLRRMHNPTGVVTRVANG